jgi:hypothetical protein
MKRCLIHITEAKEHVPVDIAIHQRYSFFEFSFEDHEQFTKFVNNFMSMFKEANYFYNKAKQE